MWCGFHSNLSRCRWCLRSDLSLQILPKKMFPRSWRTVSLAVLCSFKIASSRFDSWLYKSQKPGLLPIIVKFVRCDTKDAFYQARIKLKDMTSKALGFPDENRMYISQSLSAANCELFNKAYKLKKDLDYKFLWTSNRRVLLRATEAPSVISIHSLDLVKKIRNQNGRSRPEEAVAQGQNLQDGISNL